MRLPYPGLRSFRKDESDLFFGRESCVDQMVDRLAAARFLAVLGPSGGGKSSLVRTGLLDALELGAMASAGSRWLIADFRPGRQPLDNLAHALLALAPGAGAALSEQEFVRYLRRGPRSVVAWCREGNLPAGANLLILVDQFEELFRYADYAGRDDAQAFLAPLREDAESFAALLIESARSRETHIYVVITMRSEYLGACALFPDLAEEINAGLYLTRRMTREETREAIEGPAGVCGFSIEPALVNRLLNDLASLAPWEDEAGAGELQALARRADQLPLMQHVLNRLWLRTRAEADPAAGSARVTLRLAQYQELGGLSGALNAHAEEVLDSIDPAHRPAARTVFRSLVSGSSIADAVRRPCRFGELAEKLGGKTESAAAIVEAFRHRDCNFIVASPAGPLASETMIDISHESLIRQWLRLSEWLRDEANAAKEYAYIAENAKRWQSGSARLLGMPYLAIALAWRARERPSAAWARRYGGDFAAAMRFLDLSEQRWRRSRNATVAAAVAAALLIFVGGPVGGYEYWRLHEAARWDTLGNIYLSGADYRRDDVLAAKDFIKAAGYGSIDAEHRIGFMYFNGVGVPTDYKAGMRWLRKAAAAGNAAATFDVGIVYRDGIGVRVDYPQAMAWFRRAADKGYGAAELNIGALYASGHGVPQSSKEALVWYKKAAAQGIPVAEYDIGLLYENGEGVRRDYPSAAHWYSEAAAQGNARAQVNLGAMYERGEGMKQDDDNAAYWYGKAAAQGDAGGERNLGRLYTMGKGVPKDYGEAMRWLRAAADQGDADAENSLGYLYDSGEGVSQDYGQAMLWFRKAAAQGDAEAENNIGFMYDRAEGVHQDYGQAMEWYRKAAAQGDAGAERNLAVLYEQGLGVKRDPSEAIVWWQKLADLGDANAEREVGGIEVSEGKLEPAFAAYRQAARLAEAALAKNPQDIGARNVIRSLTWDLGNLSWYFNEKGAFQDALDAANLSIAIAPSSSSWLWLQTNKADALMMLGQTDAARAIYLKYADNRNDGVRKAWHADVEEDFQHLRQAGYSSKLMAEIEADFKASN
ncbi:MAG TPA: hypothetical protein VMF62_19415 [Acetobacteraceae bacterium]|nr:hypothetical protein [Acetobacteraceae bacterium]